ncbi:hypothetical protein Tco_0375449 [Tanacetum coccineum]
MRVWFSVKRMERFDGSTYCVDEDLSIIYCLDGVAKGFTNVFSSNIAFGTLSAIVAGDCLYLLLCFELVNSVKLPLESEELEVLEQPEQFLEQMTVV